MTTLTDSERATLNQIYGDYTDSDVETLEEVMGDVNARYVMFLTYTFRQMVSIEEGTPEHEKKMYALCGYSSPEEMGQVQKAQAKERLEKANALAQKLDIKL